MKINTTHILATSSSIILIFCYRIIHKLDIRLKKMIRERKTVKEILRQNEENIRLLAEDANQGIAIINESGLLLFVNCQLEDIVDLNRDQLIGKKISIIIEKSELDNALIEFKKVIRGKVDSSTFEFTISGKGAMKVRAMISCKPTSWHCNPAGLLFIKEISTKKSNKEALFIKNEETEQRIQEITSPYGNLKKQLPEDIKRWEMMTDQLIRNERLACLVEMTTGIFHEIRNPIAIIRSTAQFLRSETFSINPEIDELAEILVDTAENVNSSVYSLLQFARPRKGEIRPGSILEVLHYINRLITKLCCERRVKLVAELPQTLPQMMINKIQLESVFLNLYLNALDAMPDGGMIKVFAEQRDGKVIVIVSDTGSGIQKEISDRIFEPFFTTKDNGTGLGLSIVNEIMKDHYGDVKTEQKYGFGAVFVLTFPIREKKYDQNTDC